MNKLEGATIESKSNGEVRVLEVDAALLEAVPPSGRETARMGLRAKRVSAARGPWRLEGLVDTSGLGILVTEGLLTRDVQIAGTRSREILGAGDVLRPWDDDSTLNPVPSRTTWTVLEPTVGAVLDQRWKLVASPLARLRRGAPSSDRAPVSLARRPARDRGHARHGGEGDPAPMAPRRQLGEGDFGGHAGPVWPDP